MYKIAFVYVYEFKYEKRNLEWYNNDFYNTITADITSITAAVDVAEPIIVDDGGVAAEIEASEIIDINTTNHNGNDNDDDLDMHVWIHMLHLNPAKVAEGAHGLKYKKMVEELFFLLKMKTFRWKTA